MQLRIVGCPDKELFRPYVRRAVHFYAKKLFSPQMLANIAIKIKFNSIRFNSKNSNHGQAEIHASNDSNKPREFIITIHPGITARYIFETLAHEMVHIKQFAECKVNESLTRWQGNKVDFADEEYWDQPWEIEAYGRQKGLFQEFVIEEKLYEVFTDINNPEDPLIPSPLGWKV